MVRLTRPEWLSRTELATQDAYIQYVPLDIVPQEPFMNQQLDFSTLKTSPIFH